LNTGTACITKIPRKIWESLPGRKSWDWLLKRYHQPDWCNYPDALHPLGCWGLLAAPWKHRKDHGGCWGCELNNSLPAEQKYNVALSMARVGLGCDFTRYFSEGQKRKVEAVYPKEDE
jgi:hypothetical protein